MSVSEADILGYILYGGAIGLIVIGVFAVISLRHLIRVLLGLALVEAGVNLFVVAVGFRPDATAPIITGAVPGAMVDPVPQALVLTSIVIGVGVLAVGLALAMRAYQTYGTLDTSALAQAIAQEPRPAATERQVKAGQP
jgi:multisubunit Na+/H+ antiporter MnhC subunit